MSNNAAITIETGFHRLLCAEKLVGLRRVLDMITGY